MGILVRHGARQAGFTVVEMIVAVAVLALVMAMIAPSFYLLNRLYTTWGDNGQARTVGLTAESALQRDVRSYGIATAVNGTLVLQGASQPGDPGDPPGQSTYCVSYTIGGPGLLGLVRTVTYPGGAVVSRATVAHGVLGFTAAQAGASVQVTVTVAGVGGAPVAIQPPLVLTPRVDPAISKPRWVCP